MKVKRPLPKHQDRCVEFERNKVVNSDPDPGGTLGKLSLGASNAKEVILVRTRLDKSFGFKINKIAKKSNVFIISK